MTERPALVPFELTICGVQELGDHCDVGVSHVLSLLDPGFPDPDAFGAYGEHERLDLRFHDIIDEVPGMVAPGRADVEALLRFGEEILTEGLENAHLLVHCHMGVSRSTASMALLLAQACPRAPAETVFEEIVRLRPQAWPNLRIVEMGDTILGRRGELVAAVRRHYQASAARNPDRARFMAEAGRGRELEGVEGY